MKIAVGSDHRGLELKSDVINALVRMGHEYKDFGVYDENPVDYPDIALLIGKAVTSGDYEAGILICGTGIGMSIAANKIKGIRAALCHDSFMAQRARQHNDANILCLGAERPANAKDILSVFLSTRFEGGRHARRIAKIKEIENGCRNDAA
jgi:ribose 5-phosphate isomerase B